MVQSQDKQQQIRIKYGSKQQKQNFYSSRMQGMMPDQVNPTMELKVQQSQHMTRNNSQQSLASSQSITNSNIIRLKHQEMQNTQNMQRQKSADPKGMLDSQGGSQLISRANQVQKKMSLPQGPPQANFAPSGFSSTKAGNTNTTAQMFGQTQPKFITTSQNPGTV